MINNTNINKNRDAVVQAIEKAKTLRNSAKTEEEREKYNDQILEQEYILDYIDRYDLNKTHNSNNNPNTSNNTDSDTTNTSSTIPNTTITSTPTVSNTNDSSTHSSTITYWFRGLFNRPLDSSNDPYHGWVDDDIDI